MLSGSASDSLEVSVKMAEAVTRRLDWDWEIGLHAHP